MFVKLLSLDEKHLVSTRSPIVAEMLPASIQNHAYDARLTRVAQGEGKTEKDDSEVFQWDFNTADVICFALSAVFGLWYMWQKVGLMFTTTICYDSCFYIVY